LQVSRACEASGFEPLFANSVSCAYLLRCNLLTQTMLSFTLLKFRISGLLLSTPLGLCCSSVQHMCPLASSNAYLNDHHACTKVGHSPIAPFWGMKRLWSETGCPLAKVVLKRSGGNGMVAARAPPRQEPA